MPIILNGGNNPTAVMYNSTNLGSVYFAPNGNSNFVQVWGSDGGNYPLSISQIRAYNSFISSHSEGRLDGSFDIYLNNLVFKRKYIASIPSSGYMEMRYEYETQNATIELHWRSGEFCGYIFPPSDISAMQKQMEGSAATVSGIPSAFSGYSKGVLTGLTWPIDYTYEDYTHTWSQRTTVTQEISWLGVNDDEENGILLNPVSTPLVLDENAAWCYAATTGLITGGTATLRFYTPL